MFGRLLPGLLAAALVAAAQGPSLRIAPDRALDDQPVSITVTGLQRHERVTLTASLKDGADARWESHAEFIADDQGNVDLATQAPDKGSYKDCSAMGLIWSMKPAEKGVNVYRAPQNFAPQLIRFAVLRDGNAIATAQLQQDTIADGVRQIKVTGKLHGTLFVPPGAGARPAVLVLGGSEGGQPARRAAWLASHGYAALALAYFHFEGLPDRLEAIPLEYFGEAIGWLTTRPEVDQNRLAVMGVSRGGELALQLGSMYPQLKAVVAYVPANVRHGACCGGTSVPYAWTWKGEPLAFVRMNERSAADARAEIMVEKTKGPIFLIAGEDDRVWDSPGMVKDTVARLKRAHFAYRVESMLYPHAGHIAGRPEIIPAWYGATLHPVSGRPIDYGGTPEGNALSSIDAIPRVLEFLSKSF